MIDSCRAGRTGRAVRRHLRSARSWSLYGDLSSPTVAASALLAVAAIAADEGRVVETMDTGGAFLNAVMKPTGVVVNMLLDRLMTKLLLKIAPEYREYVGDNGTLVVELDKALYGCVEAAKLWYDLLTKQLREYGFEPNPYDPCVLNKTGEDGDQITIVLHVDDLFITGKARRTWTCWQCT